MRESQRKISKLPYTSFINTIDLGDAKNISAKDKLAISNPLSLESAKETLSKDVVSEGPIMNNVEVKKRKIVVSYSNADELKTTDGNAPSGFWIPDDTMKWKLASAKIKRQRVVLKSEGIKKPLFIRYAFSGKPNVNLVNEASMPVYPFRTDCNKS